MNDFIKAYKSWLIGLTITLITGIGGTIWYYTKQGLEFEADKKLKEKMVKYLSDDNVVETLMGNPKFVEKILTHPKVKEYTDQVGMGLRDKIIDDVTKKDSAKINQNAYLAKELGIRDEDLTPLLLNLLKDYKEGNMATKEDVSPRRTNRVSF